MGSDVVLSAGVRQNLLSLQSTAQLMSITQNRLATGKKVNSALDNPVNFFTSSGLTTRAKDLSALLDAMENGIKTIEAADNGITSIKTTIESMKSTLLQARQDKSFKSTAYSVALTTPAATDVLALSGGSVTGTVNVDLANSRGVRTSALQLREHGLQQRRQHLRRRAQLHHCRQRRYRACRPGGNHQRHEHDRFGRRRPGDELHHRGCRRRDRGRHGGRPECRFCRQQRGGHGFRCHGLAARRSRRTPPSATAQADVVVTTGAVTAPAVAASFYTAGALTKTRRRRADRRRDRREHQCQRLAHR